MSESIFGLPDDKQVAPFPTEKDLGKTYEIKRPPEKQIYPAHYIEIDLNTSYECLKESIEDISKLDDPMQRASLILRSKFILKKIGKQIEENFK